MFVVLLTLCKAVLTPSLLQVKRLVNVIKGFTDKSPDSVDRTALRRAAHSLAELSKSGVSVN